MVVVPDVVVTGVDADDDDVVVVGVTTPLDATPVEEYTTSLTGTASVELMVTKVCPSAGGGTRF